MRIRIEQRKQHDPAFSLVCTKPTRRLLLPCAADPIEDQTETRETDRSRRARSPHIHKNQGLAPRLVVQEGLEYDLCPSLKRWEVGAPMQIRVFLRSAGHQRSWLRDSTDEHNAHHYTYGSICYWLLRRNLPVVVFVWCGVRNELHQTRSPPVAPSNSCHPLQPCQPSTHGSSYSTLPIPRVESLADMQPCVQLDMSCLTT